MKEDPGMEGIYTTDASPKGKDEKVGVWNGKINFEDQVTRTLYAILKESRKTNRLLKKLAGKTEPDNRSWKDKALDLLDDSKINKSNVKRPSRKGKK